MTGIEKAKKKAEKLTGRSAIRIGENDRAWIFTFSFDDSDDFVVISKITGLFINQSNVAVEKANYKIIWDIDNG